MSERQQTQQSKDSKSTFQKQAAPIIQTPISNPASIIQRARINPKSLTPADVLQLQRTIGNRAVGMLLSGIRNPSTVQQAPIQRQEIPEEDEPVQRKMMGTVQRQEIKEEEEPIQTKRENNTGMPDNLKAGVESLSGIDMSDVRVHYNSSKPAEVGALAYTQGTNIHVAPGQERHLPHEAWHVVQQAQGRVRPTMQLKDGVPVNDDMKLEHEADVMGAEAYKNAITDNFLLQKKTSASTSLIQKSRSDSHIAYMINEGMLDPSTLAPKKIAYLITKWLIAPNIIADMINEGKLDPSTLHPKRIASLINYRLIAPDIVKYVINEGILDPSTLHTLHPERIASLINDGLIAPDIVTYVINEGILDPSTLHTLRPEIIVSLINDGLIAPDIVTYVIKERILDPSTLDPKTRDIYQKYFPDSSQSAATTAAATTAAAAAPDLGVAVAKEIFNIAPWMVGELASDFDKLTKSPVDYSRSPEGDPLPPKTLAWWLVLKKFAETTLRCLDPSQVEREAAIAQEAQEARGSSASDGRSMPKSGKLAQPETKTKAAQDARILAETVWAKRIHMGINERWWVTTYELLENLYRRQFDDVPKVPSEGFSEKTTKEFRIFNRYYCLTYEGPHHIYVFKGSREQLQRASKPRPPSYGSEIKLSRRSAVILLKCLNSNTDPVKFGINETEIDLFVCAFLAEPNRWAPEQVFNLFALAETENLTQMGEREELTGEARGLGMTRGNTWNKELLMIANAVPKRTVEYASSRGITKLILDVLRTNPLPKNIPDLVLNVLNFIHLHV